MANPLPSAFTNSAKVVTNPHAVQHRSSTSTQTTRPAATAVDLQNVINILRSFEIDSHIEIALVGDTFTERFARELTTSLELLSSMSTIFTPLDYVHEKLVFHVGLARTIEPDIKDIFMRGASDATHEGRIILDPDSMGNVLAEYHRRAATPTTLFILQMGPLTGTYSYKSVMPYCTQRAFISASGFAWLDLSALAFVVGPSSPGNDILPYPDLSNLQPSSRAHELASLIFRSGEALVPFPFSRYDMEKLSSSQLYSSSTLALKFQEENGAVEARNNKELKAIAASPKETTRKVDILLITMCLDDEPSLCEEDVSSKAVVERLIQFHSSASLKIGFTTLKFSCHDEPQLSHAIHASTNYKKSSTSNVAMLQTSELLYWLGSSSLIRDALSRMSGDHGGDANHGFGFPGGASSIAPQKILPVFIFKTPANMEIYLDGYTMTQMDTFPEPPGGWGLSKLDKDPEAQEAMNIASTLSWPDAAIVALRPYNSVTKDGELQQTVSYESSGLECGGIGVPAGPGYSDEVLMLNFREAIWGILPSHLHYSSASKSVVTDYLWATPPSLIRSPLSSSSDRAASGTKGTYNNGESFREKRSVPRSTLIKRAVFIITRFTSTIKQAHNMVPAVNITDLLDLSSFYDMESELFALTSKPPASSSAATTATSSSSSTSSKKFSSSSSSQSKNAKKNRHAPAPTKSKGISSFFSNLLMTLDQFASDISHLEFEAATLRLNNAEVMLSTLESSISNIVSQRQGSITCDLSNLDADGSSDAWTAGDTNGSSTRGSTDYFKWLLLGASIVLGTFIGAFTNLASGLDIFARKQRWN